MSNQALAEIRTAILLGESTLALMDEYDWIEMENGQIVDRMDVEADTQRQVDALARMAFEQKLA